MAGTLHRHLIPDDEPADGVVANTLRDYRMLYRTLRSDPDQREADVKPTMLGADQYDLLVQRISSLSASWKVIDNPVIMAQMLQG